MHSSAGARDPTLPAEMEGGARRGRGRWLRSLGLVACALGVGTFFTQVLQPSIVRGASMRPTLEDGDRIFVECLSPHFGALRRGDVVVLVPPGADGERYVKRIVGMPGDVVAVSDGQIRVNGEVFARGVLTAPLSDRTVVPEDAYFVVGDNVNHSFDSRVFGTVPRARVIGRVVGR
jgi:signal peptidase I